jgi:hypothetical protein
MAVEEILYIYIYIYILNMHKLVKHAKAFSHSCMGR